MEKYRKRLQAAHIELEPYEKESSEARARMDVATAERKLLVEKVSPHSSSSLLLPCRHHSLSFQTVLPSAAQNSSSQR
jgi:hypothetical protein